PARSWALLETLVSTIQRHRAVSMPEAHHAAPEPAAAAVPSAASAAQAAPQRPAAAERAMLAPPPVRPRPALADGGGLDILVAEDNEVNHLVFTQILAETDYRFEIVGNDRKSLDACFRLKPRTILMDVSMPEMNGLEATGEIRRREAAEGTHVPIV